MIMIHRLIQFALTLQQARQTVMSQRGSRIALNRLAQLFNGLLYAVDVDRMAHGCDGRDRSQGFDPTPQSFVERWAVEVACADRQVIRNDSIFFGHRLPISTTSG